MGVIKRSYDPELIHRIIDELADGHTSVDPVEWVKDERNVILVDDNDNVAVFEHMSNGLVNGHYYFTARGREAINVGRIFLDNIFNELYNIEVIRGLTPITNLGARWMSRQLGFTSHGVVTARGKHYELFLLTKKEFK